jgi:hypothetical protein
MALVAPTVTELHGAIPTRLFKWTGMTYSDGDIANDGGEPIEITDYPDMTVTIDGTFSTGGSCTLKGSMDGVSYYALTDPQGNSLAKTAAAIESVVETPRYIRPHVTAGDGSTAIDCTLLVRRITR